MTTRGLSAGVIGASGMGADHVAALRRIGVETAMIAGSTEARAKATALRLGVLVWTDDASALIRSAGIDVVHICTPTGLHAEQVTAVLEAGRPVVCEKPVATTAAQASAMAELAAAPGAPPALLCQPYREAAGIAALRTIIAEGALGEVRVVRASYLQGWGLAGDRGWRADPRHAGASGLLSDIGCHLLDLVEIVSGSTFASANAEVVGSGPHDAAAMTARLASGAIASLALSQTSAGRINELRVEVDGTDGAATWSLDTTERLDVLNRAGDRSTFGVRARRRRADGIDAAKVLRITRSGVSGWAERDRRRSAGDLVRRRATPRDP